MSRDAWVIVLIGLAGCSLQTIKKGGTCERSTECVAGLACVSGKCGSDLSSIAAHNTVPMLGGGRGGAAAGAGAAGAAGAQSAGASGQASDMLAGGQGGS